MSLTPYQRILSSMMPFSSVVGGKPFPFMRLPPELRRVIYRMLYPAEHVTFDWSNTYPGHSMMYEHYGIPPLMVSKEIYRESRATILSGTQFRINNIPILRKFLIGIGPEGRKLLTALEIKYTAHGAVNAFKLLAECTALRSLAIIVQVQAAPYRKQPTRLMARSGLNELLAIRGIQELDLTKISIKIVSPSRFPDGVDYNQKMLPLFNQDKENFVQALQVLKLPRA